MYIHSQSLPGLVVYETTSGLSGVSSGATGRCLEKSICILTGNLRVPNTSPSVTLIPPLPSNALAPLSDRIDSWWSNTKSGFTSSEILRITSSLARASETRSSMYLRALRNNPPAPQISTNAPTTERIVAISKWGKCRTWNRVRWSSGTADRSGSGHHHNGVKHTQIKKSAE